MKNLALTVSALLLAACNPQITDDSSQRISVNNDESALLERVAYEDTLVSIDPLPASKPNFAASSDITLTLVAEVQSPLLRGQALQATEVRVLGNKAYVSYNIQGSEFGGGVEIIDFSQPSRPKLISSAIFSDTDINGLSVEGNNLMLAAASNISTYDSPAVFERITLKSGKLSDTSEQLDLPSFATTDVDVASNYIYITSGSEGGGLSIYDRRDLSFVSFTAIDDARSVDADPNHVAIMAGTPARVYSFDAQDGTALAEFPLTGATIPFSKSTIEVKNSKAVVAAGDGGTQVVCLTDGSVLASISQPLVNGLDSSVTVTNSATAYQNLIFMGNGEAGVYMAIADSNFNSNQCTVDNLRVAGKLGFDALQSVNHVTHRANLLFIAAGTGGLKIVRVDNATAAPDDDDTLP